MLQVLSGLLRVLDAGSVLGHNCYFVETEVARIRHLCVFGMPWNSRLVICVHMWAECGREGGMREKNKCG